MPSVTLSDYECRRGLLPDVCAFCGAPAAGRRERTFSWHPSWVWVLILINLIVVALVLTKRMTVRVPVCEAHDGFWRRRATILLTSFLLIALFVGAAVAFSMDQPPGGPDLLQTVMCGGGIVLVLAWVVLAAVYSVAGVRPTEITDRDIRLTGLHEDFVAALREERARDRGRRREGRYGDERDDYDDDPDDEPPRRRPRYDDRDRDDWREWDRG